jgi:hypothetical protein
MTSDWPQKVLDQTPSDDGKRPGVVERAEAAAGLVLFALSAASVMAATFWFLGTANSRPELKSELPLFSIIAAGMNAAALASGYFLVRAFARARSSPVLVDIAQQQPQFNVLVQVAAVVWWGWQFASMAVAADMFWEEFRLRFTSLSQGAAATLLRVAVMFSTSAAANLFLLLALGAMSCSRSTLRTLYRLRFVVDLAIAVSLLGVPSRSLLLFRVPFIFLFRIVFRQ